MLLVNKITYIVCPHIIVKHSIDTNDNNDNLLHGKHVNIFYPYSFHKPYKLGLLVLYRYENWYSERYIRKIIFLVASC